MVIFYFVLKEAPSELYGPLMITLSLVAVLLYGMKSSGHEIVSSDDSIILV